MLVIKTQICRTSPPRSANLCQDISLTHIFISPLNVPSLVTEKSCTPPPHAAAARRHRCLCRTLPLPAAATSLTTAARNRRTLYSTAAIADAFSDNNGETVVPSRVRCVH